MNGGGPRWVWLLIGMALVLAACALPAAEEVVPALIRALGDNNPEVRWVVLSALKTVTGQDFGPDTLRWQSWWEEQKHSEGGNCE